MRQSSSSITWVLRLRKISELDLFEAFNKHAGDERIPDVVKDMERELGEGNKNA